MVSSSSLPCHHNLNDLLHRFNRLSVPAARLETLETRFSLAAFLSNLILLLSFSRFSPFASPPLSSNSLLLASFFSLRAPATPQPALQGPVRVIHSFLQRDSFQGLLRLFLHFHLPSELFFSLHVPCSKTLTYSRSIHDTSEGRCRCLESKPSQTPSLALEASDSHQHSIHRGSPALHSHQLPSPWPSERETGLLLHQKARQA